MKVGLRIAVILNLLLVAVLTFAYPHLLVGPGGLLPGHRALDAHCLACHVPFAGARAERCIACHRPAEIGRLTTKGLAVLAPRTAVPFHQQLLEPDCIACHRDHAGVRRLEHGPRFRHALLRPDTRAQCQACHVRPEAPGHRSMTGDCGACHDTRAWTPASFDHDQHFVLDATHRADCAACHPQGTYRTYTCFGCHAHTPENVRDEHAEEGIRDLGRCARCHRRAAERD